jgi:hypothetical protein
LGGATRAPVRACDGPSSCSPAAKLVVARCAARTLSPASPLLTGVRCRVRELTGPVMIGGALGESAEAMEWGA